jgi:hypothetical protein
MNQQKDTGKTCPGCGDKHSNEGPIYGLYAAQSGKMLYLGTLSEIETYTKKAWGEASFIGANPQHPRKLFAILENQIMASLKFIAQRMGHA